MHLSEARRVVLFNYNDETGSVDFRHYTIVVKPVGVTKGVKRVIMSTNVPSLAGYGDISEYVLREAFASESDMEDGPDTAVTLAQDYVGRGNRKDEQRAVRLLELGPRMELKLMKVEGGLCQGDILFHSYLHKSKAEIEKQARVRQIKLTQQARRRQEQASNVERKKKESKKGKPKNDDSDDEEAEESGSGNDDESEDESTAIAAAEEISRKHRAADDFGADAMDADVSSDSGASESDADDGGSDSDAPSSSKKPAKRAKTGLPKATKKAKAGAKRK
ncbi:rRNA-binding ribosome biosynthesis protein [Coemansia sp. RSA 2559]|nr:rRNA-binding ribosome biosynthesis protein [Coemansia sp. RSA 2559]